MLLKEDQFLSRLTLMFDQTRGKGHVQLTMKRYDGKTKPAPRPEKIVVPEKGKKGAKGVKQTQQEHKNSRSDSSSQDHSPGEFMCLIRAKCRDKKISCIVHPKDLNKFQLAYSNLLKSNMDGLKRQKKQKSKKATQS